MIELCSDCEARAFTKRSSSAGWRNRRIASAFARILVVLIGMTGAGAAAQDVAADAGPAPGDAPPGDAPPGDAVPGDAPPGDAPPGDAVPDEAPPGDAPPGDAVPDEAAPGDLPSADRSPTLHWPAAFRQTFPHRATDDPPFLGTGWSDDWVIFAGAGLAAELGSHVIAVLSEFDHEALLIGVGPAVHAGGRSPLTRALELVGEIALEWYSFEDDTQWIGANTADAYRGISMWLLRANFGAHLRPGDGRFYVGLLAGAGYAGVSGTWAQVEHGTDVMTEDRSKGIVQLQATVTFGLMLGTSRDWAVGMRVSPALSFDGEGRGAIGGAAEILIDVPVVRL